MNKTGLPNLREEKQLFKKGYQYIAGIDEVGRGPLAGPVVAACVVLKNNNLNKWLCSGIKNSKKLSSQKRNQLSKIILREAVAWGIGRVSEKIIDKINIRQATILAMRRAFDKVKVPIDYLLIDGRDTITDLPVNQKAIINGDEKSIIIAAASIIAKERRDDIMRRYHLTYPVYGFAQHKGYGTKMHFAMIKKYGPCKIHRQSFHPIKDILHKQGEVA